MHSSRAACVFGEARLISSTRSKFAKTGPGRNSNSFVRWSKTFTPVTSDGSRSGVNWMRENEQSSERASALASIVFPTPGKSSMIRCPSLTSVSTASRRVSWGAWTTWPTLSVMRARTSPEISTLWGRSSVRRSATVLLEQPLDLVPDLRRDPGLRRPAHRSLPRLGNQHDLVLPRLEPHVGPGHIVVDDQIRILAGPLRPGAGQTAVSGLGGEPD